MYPSLLAAHCAILKGNDVEFPVTAGWMQHRNASVVRVVMKGGHYFDAPATACLESKPRRLVSSIRAGDLLPCPSATPSTKTSEMPYDYWAPNNRGVLSNYKGKHIVTCYQAELLGWLLGEGSLHAERQSIRFISGDTAKLHRVALVSSRAFSNLNVRWYAKNGAYDLTLTSGIDNPLRHFIRMCDFYEGCPMAFGRHLSEDKTIDFLRGVWGANGWLYVKKGGNDVSFGLNRIRNEYLFSWLRLLHATLGMYGARETSKDGAFRLVFSGYRNYATFKLKIDQIGDQRLAAAPVHRSMPTAPRYLAQDGNQWYDAPVLKVHHLAQSQTPIYEPSPCLKQNTKHTQVPA